MSKIKVRSVEHAGEIRFQLDIPAELNRGKRWRRLFSTEAEALQHGDEHMGFIKEHGQSALESAGFTFNDALKRFRSLKEMSGRHESTADAVYNKFSKVYGTARIKTISPMDLQAFWTRKEWAPTTRVKVFRYLRLLFNWLERYDIIDRNPARRVEPPKDDEAPKNILIPQRMQEFLAINDDILRAFLCLGGFAGLRTCEILTLQEQDIEETEIRVSANTKDERWVTRLPVFDAHWRSLPKLPATTDFYKHIRMVTGATVKGRRIIGGGIPANSLRHSFGSYHLGMWEDAGKTAFQMGNSAGIVEQYYARRVRKKQAEAWWAIGIDLR